MALDHLTEDVYKLYNEELQSWETNHYNALMGSNGVPRETATDLKKKYRRSDSIIELREISEQELKDKGKSKKGYDVDYYRGALFIRYLYLMHKFSLAKEKLIQWLGVSNFTREEKDRLEEKINELEECKSSGGPCKDWVKTKDFHLEKIVPRDRIGPLKSPGPGDAPPKPVPGSVPSKPPSPTTPIDDTRQFLQTRSSKNIGSFKTGPDGIPEFPGPPGPVPVAKLYDPVTRIEQENLYKRELKKQIEQRRSRRNKKPAEIQKAAFKNFTNVLWGTHITATRFVPKNPKDPVKVTDAGPTWPRNFVEQMDMKYAASETIDAYYDQETNKKNPDYFEIIWGYMLVRNYRRAIEVRMEQADRLNWSEEYKALFKRNIRALNNAINKLCFDERREKSRCREAWVLATQVIVEKPKKLLLDTADFDDSLDREVKTILAVTIETYEDDPAPRRTGRALDQDKRPPAVERASYKGLILSDKMFQSDLNEFRALLKNGKCKQAEIAGQKLQNKITDFLQKGATLDHPELKDAVENLDDKVFDCRVESALKETSAEKRKKKINDMIAEVKRELERLEMLKDPVKADAESRRKIADLRMQRGNKQIEIDATEREIKEIEKREGRETDYSRMLKGRKTELEKDQTEIETELAKQKKIDAEKKKRRKSFTAAHAEKVPKLEKRLERLYELSDKKRFRSTGGMRRAITELDSARENLRSKIKAAKQKREERVRADIELENVRRESDQRRFEVRKKEDEELDTDEQKLQELDGERAYLETRRGDAEDCEQNKGYYNMNFDRCDEKYPYCGPDKVPVDGECVDKKQWESERGGYKYPCDYPAEVYTKSKGCVDSCRDGMRYDTMRDTCVTEEDFYEYPRCPKGKYAIDKKCQDWDFKYGEPNSCSEDEFFDTGSKSCKKARPATPARSNRRTAPTVNSWFPKGRTRRSQPFYERP